MSRSEKSSPKSKQSKQLQPKYSKAKSRSLPSSPQGELNDEYFDEYENVEETLKVYTASDGKISAFWTIPTKYIRNVLENSHQVLLIHRKSPFNSSLISFIVSRFQQKQQVIKNGTCSCCSRGIQTTQISAIDLRSF